MSQLVDGVSERYNFINGVHSITDPAYLTNMKMQHIFTDAIDGNEHLYDRLESDYNDYNRPEYEHLVHYWGFKIMFK